MAEDLQAENNRFHRLFRQFSSESKAVSIATVALVVAVLSLLMAFMALNDAKDAKIRGEFQSQYIEDLSDDIGVMEVYISQHKAKHKEKTDE